MAGLSCQGPSGKKLASRTPIWFLYSPPPPSLFMKCIHTDILPGLVSACLGNVWAQCIRSRMEAAEQGINIYLVYIDVLSLVCLHTIAVCMTNVFALSLASTPGVSPSLWTMCSTEFTSYPLTLSMSVQCVCVLSFFVCVQTAAGWKQFPVALRSWVWWLVPVGFSSIMWWSGKVLMLSIS